MHENPDDVRCGLYGQLQSGVILCGPWDTCDATVPSHNPARRLSPAVFAVIYRKLSAGYRALPAEILEFCLSEAEKTAKIGGPATAAGRLILQLP